MRPWNLLSENQESLGYVVAGFALLFMVIAFVRACIEVSSREAPDASPATRLALLGWILMMHTYPIALIPLGRDESIAIGWVLGFFFFYLPFVGIANVQMLSLIHWDSQPQSLYEMISYSAAAVLWIIALIVAAFESSSRGDSAAFTLCFLATILVLLGTPLRTSYRGDYKTYYVFLIFRMVLLALVALWHFQSFFLVFTISEVIHTFAQVLFPTRIHKTQTAASGY